MPGVSLSRRPVRGNRGLHQGEYAGAGHDGAFAGAQRATGVGQAAAHAVDGDVGFDPVAGFGAGDEIGGEADRDDGLCRFARTGDDDAQRRVDHGDEEAAMGDVADVAMPVFDADGEDDLALVVAPVVPGAEADQVAAAALERLEAVGDVAVHFCRPWIFSGFWGDALFEEGAEDFLGGGGGDQVGEVDHLLVHRLDRATVRRALHQRLGHGQRLRGQGGEFLRRGQRGRHQLVGRHHAVDEAGLARRRRIEGLAEQQQFRGALVAGDARQHQAGPGFGAEREVHEGELELGVVGRIDQVAMQQQRGADAHRVAGDGRHQRLFEGRQQVQEGDRRAGVTRLAMQEVGQVVAGREQVVLAADQHGPDVVMVAGMKQRRAHGAVHVAGDGVLLVAAADLDADDAVAVGDEDVGMVHGHWTGTQKDSGAMASVVSSRLRNSSCHWRTLGSSQR
jgi:hypothetical protein